MARNRTWLALLAAVGLGAALLMAGESGAQLADPPLGWDMWDPSWTRRDTWRPEHMDEISKWRMSRHQAFIRDGVPGPYQGAQNPLTRTPANVEHGRALYAANCVPCHDPTGMGRGEAGSALYPSPALLAQLIRMPEAVDGYLMWAISEGGQPFGTQMPAFKDRLSQDQIWQIITYMRAGFPPAAAN
jgi:mono/diheme cytochrome c family protein